MENIEYSLRLPSGLTEEELNDLDSLRIPEINSDLDRLVQRFRRALNSCDKDVRLAVANAGDTIIGWSAVEVWGVVPWRPVTLLNTFVRPSYRNKGIGRALARMAYKAYPMISKYPPTFKFGEGDGFYLKILRDLF